MTQLKSAFLTTLQERGFFYQCTDLDGLDQALQESKPLAAYIGFDVTADCLHVGSLVQIMLLYWLQQTGGKPIVVIGGGTTKIGDPSGKDESRKLLESDKIQANKQAIFKLLQRFIRFGDGPTDAILVDNAQWLESLNYIDFLRDIGREFTINRMLTFESVKSRLNRQQPLTFLEFNYMLLQAYDFVELQQRYDCRLQLGGADPWGNIVSGVELARRKLQTTLYGYTVPLITTSDGKKMGKTASGAVWLSDSHLPSYDFWQFWRNTPDSDVERFLKLFTTLPLEEIKTLSSLKGQATNEAKIALANAVTTFCHSEEAALQAASTAKQTFTDGHTGSELPNLEINSDITIIDAMVDIGFAQSKSAAKRLMAGGGVRLDNEKIFDENYIIRHDMNQAIKLSVGKKTHGMIKVCQKR